MTNYEIQMTANNRFNVLVDAENRAVEYAHISNKAPGGWQARCTEKADNARGYVAVGEPVNVSRLINQHNGAKLIAEALGL